MLPRFDRARVVALVLTVAAVPACSDDVAAPPDDAPAPTFVVAPSNPADDPQLDALIGLVEESGENVRSPSRISEERVAALPLLFAELRSLLGPATKVARVDVARSTATVRADDTLTDWTWVPGQGLVSNPTPARDADQLTDPSWDLKLTDVDPEVPQQVLAGIDRATDSPSVRSIELTDDEQRPPTWRFVVATGRSPATVIADLDGSVLTVRWWE